MLYDKQSPRTLTNTQQKYPHKKPQSPAPLREPQRISAYAFNLSSTKRTPTDQTASQHQYIYIQGNIEQFSM